MLGLLKVKASEYVIKRRIREITKNKFLLPLRKSEIAGLELVGISRGPKRMMPSRPGADSAALIELDEVLEGVCKGLVAGAKKLTHVPHCLELRGSWAQLSVGFVKWWVDERLAKLVGLSGAPSEERSVALQGILNEFDCRFASLLCEYEAQCGALITEPQITVALASSLSKNSALPSWWPNKCRLLGIGISYLTVAAAREACNLILDPSECEFAELPGYGGRVFQMKKPWRWALMGPVTEQGICGKSGVEVNEAQLAVVQGQIEDKLCTDRADDLNCVPRAAESSQYPHMIVEVSDVLIGHMIMMMNIDGAPCEAAATVSTALSRQTEIKAIRTTIVPRLGIDCGGVLSLSDTDVSGACAENSNQSRGQSLASSMQAHPPTDACISAVAALVQQFRPENTYIVSKCGTSTQQGTFVWLTVNHFFERTGFLRSNVYFCKNRSGIDADDHQVTYEPLATPSPKLLKELSTATGCNESDLTAMFAPVTAKVAYAANPNTRDRACGKGVICRDLKLTHFIDDRAECLHSVFFEGHLQCCDADPSKAASTGCMIHFGSDVFHTKIHREANKDTDLQKLLLLKAPPKATPVQAPAELPDEVWFQFSEVQQAQWSQRNVLRAEKPAVTVTKGAKRGKPDAQQIEMLKEHKRKEKQFENSLGAATVSLFKRFETATKRACLKANAAAKPTLTPKPAKQRGRNWTIPDAAEFWNARFQVDHIAPDWDSVLVILGTTSRV